MTQAHRCTKSNGQGLAAGCQASQPITSKIPSAQAACAEVQRLLHRQLGNVNVCLHGRNSVSWQLAFALSGQSALQ